MKNFCDNYSITKQFHNTNTTKLLSYAIMSLSFYNNIMTFSKNVILRKQTFII